MSEMDIIERMAKSVLKEAETRPPKEAWDAIEKRLAAEPSAAPGAKPSRSRLKWAVGSVCAAAAVAAVVGIALSRPQEQQSVLAQQVETVVLTDVTDSVVSAVGTSSPEASSAAREAKEVPAVSAAPAITASEPAAPVMAPPLAQGINAASTSAAVVEETVSAPPEAGEPVPASVSNPDTQTAGNNRPAVSPTVSDTVVNSKPQINIVVPNLLSPNGDGYNDCWVLPDLSSYGTVQVQIYTAKSQRVYSSTDYRNDFCGDDLPDGNYFYVLNFRDIGKSRRGVLVIKR